MAKMMAWPADDKPANFEDITRPLHRALRFAYTMRRKNEDKDVPWNGLERGGLHCCLPARASLTADNLRYSKEDQGRDALTEILGLAVALGIEQGRRIEVSDAKHRTKRLVLEMAKHLADAPPTDTVRGFSSIAGLLASALALED